MPFDIEALDLNDDQRAAIETELETRNQNVREVNSSLKTEKQAALDKLAQATEKLNSFQDQSKKLEELNAQLEEAKKNGGVADVEAIEKEIRQKVSGEFTTELETLQSQVSTLTKAQEEKDILAQTLNNTLISKTLETGIATAILDKKADPMQARSANVLAKDTVTFTDSEGEIVTKPVVEVDTSGNCTFRDINTGKVLSDANGNFDFGDWVDYLAKEKHLPMYKDASGMGTTGSGKISATGMYKKTMTEDQKAEFKKQYGYEKYNALPLAPPKE